MGASAGVSDDYRFVEKFTKHGYELHFLIPKGKPADQPEFESFYAHSYPNFFRVTSRFPIPIRRLLLPLLFNLFVTPAAIRLARTLRPDFVLGHTHYGAAVAFALKKLLSIPSGVKLFGVMDLVHTEWPRWKYTFKNLEQIIAMKFPQDLWIVLDDGTRGKEALMRHGIEEAKIHFLPNGINIEWADRSFNRGKIRGELDIPRETRVVLFLARLVASKRPEMVIHAIPRVIRNTDRKILFLFVGDGPARLPCERLVVHLNVAEHVRFIGAIAHANVPEVMSASDLFVSTSSLTNMAIPTCEALVCGLPVVAFDVGDTRKIVKHNETGLVTEDGDIDSLARAILTLVNDDEKRAHMGQLAKMFAKRHFTGWEERVQRELEIINSMVQARG